MFAPFDLSVYTFVGYMYLLKYFAKFSQHIYYKAELESSFLTLDTAADRTNLLTMSLGKLRLQMKIM